MAVIKPPITGDLVLDSWLNQITQALNTGVAGTSAGGTSQVKSGASGFNTATIYLYARTSTDSAPSAMNEETTYTYKTGVLVNGDSHDGTSNGLGPNDIWFRDVPSGTGGYLWVTTVHVADTAAVETIASGSWSSVTKLSEKGDQGKFAVELYIRSSSTPSAPTDVTWTYATGALSGTNSASWALAVPSGSDQVWITSTIFDPSTSATNITSWGTPFQGGSTGPAGAAGTNNATVAIYQKNTDASSAPSNPSGTFTYTFSTGVLSAGTFNSWTQALPTLAKGEYLWMKHATASSTTNTDSIPTSEFSTAAITGAAGIDGSSVSVVELFKVSSSNSSAPADPSGTFTYTFATDALSGGTLNGWSQSAPNVPAGEYLWVIQASAVSNTTTDTIAASEFSNAVVISGVGATGATGNTGSTGATGIRQTVGRVYRTATDANAPTAPTNSNSAYSFSSNAFTTLPSGWSQTPPTPNTSDSNPYWQCTFSAVEASAGGTVTETFGTPIKVIEFDGIVKFTNSNTISDGSTTLVPPKVFRQDSTPTAITAGDIWIDTNDNNKMYAASGAGTSSWVLSQDSTAASALATAAQNTANSKTATFRQDAVPTSLAVGDIWVDTDDGNKMYVAAAVGADQVTAGEWITVQDAAIATAQTAADSKAKVFRQTGTPTATAAGDIWIDTDDDNEMYIASGAGTGNWVREDFANLINGNTTTINGGKITAGSVTAGQIAANEITAAKINPTFGTLTFGNSASNIIQSHGFTTGESGWQIKGTGDAEFNDIAVRGAITNTTTARKQGYSTDFLRVFGSMDLKDIMSQGAGLYAFVMVGAGGGGGGGVATAHSSPASGGGAGGLAMFTYDWNGSDSLSYVAGAYGNPSGTNSGGTSTLTIGSTLCVTVTGGGAGANSDNHAGGTGGTATFDNTSLINDRIARTGGQGGSCSAEDKCAAGGGAVDLFGYGASAMRGISVTDEGAGGGGSPLRKTAPVALNSSSSYALGFSSTIAHQTTHSDYYTGNSYNVSAPTFTGATASTISGPYLGGYGYGGYDDNNWSGRGRAFGMVGGIPQAVNGAGGHGPAFGGGSALVGHLPQIDFFGRGGGGGISAINYTNENRFAAYGGGGGVGGGGGGRGYSYSGSAGYGGNAGIFILKL